MNGICEKSNGARSGGAPSLRAFYAADPGSGFFDTLRLLTMTCVLSKKDHFLYDRDISRNSCKKVVEK